MPPTPSMSDARFAMGQMRVGPPYSGGLPHLVHRLTLRRVMFGLGRPIADI